MVDRHPLLVSSSDDATLLDVLVDRVGDALNELGLAPFEDPDPANNELTAIIDDYTFVHVVITIKREER